MRPKKNTKYTDSSEEEEFVVKRIIGKRLVKGRIQMLVEWEGYSSDENTWEPFCNLGNCLRLLEQYEIDQLKKNGDQVSNNKSKKKTFDYDSDDDKPCCSKNARVRNRP